MIIGGAAHRKPLEICNADPVIEKVVAADYPSFATQCKNGIAQDIAALGVTLRDAAITDMPAIKQLLSDRFGGVIQEQLNEYELFRHLRFGCSVVVESADKAILGACIDMEYGDKDQSVFSSYIAVDPQLAGHGISARLSTYTSLTGMEQGFKLKRGLISPYNFKSVKNLLNRTGYYFEEFYNDLMGEDTPRFLITEKLTPGGIFNSNIALDKVDRYIQENERGEDYELVRCIDIAGIAKLYSETALKIAAFIPGKEDAEHQFFATAIN